MKKLLHIIATPRAEESRTLQISNSFLDVFKNTHSDWAIEELDLSKEELPSLTMKRVDGKYVLLGGKDLTGEFKEAWDDIIAHIERFLSADAYLISTPMWNFGVSYMLKHYLDVILQPKYLFRYTATGVEGLVKGKRALVVITRGGEYTPESMKKLDFQEPYLRAAFGFIGIKDIEFIIAQPMDMGQEVQKIKIKEAKEQAQKLAAIF